MLIDFSVSNYKSIRDKVSLNLVNEKIEVEDETWLDGFDVDVTNGGPDVLWHYCRVSPIMSFFGANASGKSNILKALVAMRAVALGNGVENYYNPFRFSTDSQNKPTMFSIVFEKNGFVYTYVIEFSEFVVGNAFCRYQIDNEQLYWWRDKDAAPIRIFDLKQGDDIWCGEDGGYKQLDDDVFMRVVLGTSSLLSILYQEPSDVVFYSHIKRVYEFFSNDIIVADDINLLGMPSDLEQAQQQVSIVKKMFDYMDVGCCDIKLSRDNAGLKFRDKDVFDVDKVLQYKDLCAKKHLDCLTSVDCDKRIVYQDKILFDYCVESEEKGKNGKRQQDFLSMNLMQDESVGTRNLFLLLMVLVDALQKGRVFIFDEIDRTIHTELIKFLFAMVKSKHLNKFGAQMLCSSHNPCAMLGLGLFEVALVDKQRNATILRYASEYNYGKASGRAQDVFRNYMMGVIGGVPRIVDIFDGVEI